MLFVRDVAEKLQNGSYLQVYSDVGVREDGAAAYAVFIVDSETHDIELAFVEGVFVERPISAFEMEAVAADLAVERVRGFGA